MIRFGGVGIVNTLADFIIFWALIAAGAPAVAANLAGFLGANLQSYLLNSRITFRAEGRPAAVSFSGYGRFLAAHAMSLAVSTILIVVLAERVGPLPAKAAAMGFTFLWNYTMSARFVFARPACPSIRSGAKGLCFGKGRRDLAEGGRSRGRA